MTRKIGHLRESAKPFSNGPPGLPKSLRNTDLVCFSHLRWDFVYQRPQHLLSRFAKHQRVFFVEEPLYEPGAAPSLSVEPREDKLVMVRPCLPTGLAEGAAALEIQVLLRDFFKARDIERYAFWYYTPMAVPFTRGFSPIVSVYDCMDEHSQFQGAHPLMVSCEAELLRMCDVVFTGGHSLYEAKRALHHNIHPMPSSIDKPHFAAARAACEEPADQAVLPRPRIGFFGVIDERMDLALLAAVADARPEWQLIMIGPVVKIDAAQLPRRPNIHYLGMKTYQELPRYLAGWDVAMLPFARNASTEFISPTKTPEYLAAGKPVVSTAIKDVVKPYGDSGVVWIAEDAPEFVRAVQAAMDEAPENPRRGKVERLLAHMSWDDTWGRMTGFMETALTARLRRSQPQPSGAGRPLSWEPRGMSVARATPWPPAP